MYLCSHVTNRGLILPKLKEKIKCSWRKILTGLRIITGTICFIGSWPQIFSLYLSLSLSICLWIFFHNFTPLFSNPLNLSASLTCCDKDFHSLIPSSAKNYLLASISNLPLVSLISCPKFLQWKRQWKIIFLITVHNSVYLCHILFQSAVSQVEEPKYTWSSPILFHSFDNLRRKPFLKTFFSFTKSLAKIFFIYPYWK